MKLKMFAVLAALAFAMPGMAYGQHKHGHGQTEPGKNGGVIADAGDFHVELVAKGGGVEVYISDMKYIPVPIVGYKGLAILSIEGKSQRITLEAADGTKLTGKVTGNLPKEPKGVVQITPPGGKTVSAKF